MENLMGEREGARRGEIASTWTLVESYNTHVSREV